MPKKSGKKKGGSKKKKKGNEYLPLQYDIPAYEDPNFSYPVKLQIQIANPNFSCMSFPLEIPSNTKVEQVIQKIQAFHQGAINEIKIYLDKQQPENFLIPGNTLKSYKIFGTQEYLLYYDYKPLTAPILQ